MFYVIELSSYFCYLLKKHNFNIQVIFSYIFFDFHIIL